MWHAYCNSNRCKYDWLIYTAKPKNEKVLKWNYIFTKLKALTTSVWILFKIKMFSVVFNTIRYTLLHIHFSSKYIKLCPRSLLTCSGVDDCLDHVIKVPCLSFGYFKSVDYQSNTNLSNNIYSWLTEIWQIHQKQQGKQIMFLQVLVCVFPSLLCIIDKHKQFIHHLYLSLITSAFLATRVFFKVNK